MSSGTHWAGRRIRWRIFGFLFTFGLLAYAQRSSVTIAAAQMMPDLHLTQLQIGWIEQAFVVGYAMFQIPGGLLGQLLGARVAFTLFGVVAVAAMMAVPLSPALFGGTLLFVTLVGAQFLLGAAQGGVFPVSNGVFESWFPARQWALVQGAQTMGLNIGSALTPPLIAVLMETVGWQRALAWTSLPAVPVIVLWVWYARNTPQEHPAVSGVELSELGELAGTVPDRKISLRRALRVLRHRNTALLALSYLAMNYAFYLIYNWCFLYLIQQRHMPIVESGWVSMAPPLAGGLGAGIGGLLTGRLCKVLGPRWGFRAVPLVALPLAGVLLLVVMRTGNTYVAVSALTLCFGCIELNEAAYWATSMAVGRGDSMLLGGILNTGGNLGGIIGIPVVAWLSGRHAWGMAFWIGSICALVAALGWLGVDATEVVTGEGAAQDLDQTGSAA